MELSKHAISATQQIRTLLGSGGSINDSETAVKMAEIIEQMCPRPDGLGMMETVMATGLSEAVAEDEKTEGIDISAGLYGKATSDWLRKLAVTYLGINQVREPEILIFANENYGLRTWENITLKACGEMGEFAEAITKITEGRATFENADEEAGDVLFVLSQYAAKRGTTLEVLRAAAFEKNKERVALAAVKARGPLGENLDGEDDDHPLWLINAQIDGLMQGEGASEDHEGVLAFLRDMGLPESTVKRMHRAIVWGDKKTCPEIEAYEKSNVESSGELIQPQQVPKGWNGDPHDPDNGFK